MDKIQGKRLCLHDRCQYNYCVLKQAYECVHFLLSSVRLVWVTGTSLWSSTVGARMGRHFLPLNFSNLVIQLTYGKRCDTLGTGSQQVRSMLSVRAPVQDSCYLTWESVVPPVTWLLLPVCLPFSVAKAGLRTARLGLSTGLFCFTKKSA